MSEDGVLAEYLRFNIIFFYNGHVLPDTTNIENAIMPPPPDGQWARSGTVDGPIGQFLLPLGRLC